MPKHTCFKSVTCIRWYFELFFIKSNVNFWITFSMSWCNVDGAKLFNNLDLEAPRLTSRPIRSHIWKWYKILSPYTISFNMVFSIPQNQCYLGPLCSLFCNLRNFLTLKKLDRLLMMLIHESHKTNLLLELGFTLFL